MENEYIYSVRWILLHNKVGIVEFESQRDAEDFAHKLIAEDNIKVLVIDKSIRLNENIKKYDEYLPEELDSEPLYEIIYVYKKCDVIKPKGYKQSISR